MKIFKKKYLVILLTVLLVIVFSISGCSSWVNLINDMKIYSDDISAYNSGNYRKYIDKSPVFLDSIPENAQVIDYSYCELYQEEQDVYLELKFDTQEDLENYLDILIQNAENNTLKDEGSDRELFVIKQNPHNSKYTDLVCTKYASYSGALGNHISFRIEYEKEKTFFDIYHHIISYSVEELTVIQNFCHWCDYLYSYTPKYITRFNIPINENYEYIIPLD